MSEQEGLGCIRCGSYTHWTVNKMLRSYDEGSGDEKKTFYVYAVRCGKCGREEEYVTENSDAVPERVKITEEVLTPSMPFNSKIDPSSDTFGLDVTKVQPRLPNK